ncbi:unnamed protein product [Caenorhabditis brenneri]
MDPRKIFQHHLVLNPQAALHPGALGPSGSILTQEILKLLINATTLRSNLMPRAPSSVQGPYQQTNIFGQNPHLTMPLPPFLPNLSPLPLPFPPSPMLGSPPSMNITPLSPVVWLPDPAPPDYGTTEPPTTETIVIQTINALKPLENHDPKDQIAVLERIFSISSQIRPREYRRLAEKLKMTPYQVQDWYRLKRKQLKALGIVVEEKATGPQFATNEVHLAIQALPTIPPPIKKALSGAQNAALNQIFKLRPHLDRLECGALAAKISTSEKKIYDWFWRKRDKMRRDGVPVPQAPPKCGDHFLTEEQYTVLMAEFEKSTVMSAHRETVLTERLGFSGRGVYNWFQAEKLRRKKKTTQKIF